MFIKDGKMINIQAFRNVTHPMTLESGIDLVRSPERQVEFGISEINEPADPEGYNGADWYKDQTSDGSAPYYVWTRKTQAVIDEAHNGSILAQIKALESAELMPRILRDLVKKQLAAEAAAVGTTLPALYAMTTIPNPDYDPLVAGSLELLPNPSAPGAAWAWKKFKDFDDAVASLKVQLR